MSDPANSSIWIVARKVYDAPDPAKGFTEAEWGELLFDNTCEVRLRDAGSCALKPSSSFVRLVVRYEECARGRLEHLEASL